MVRVGAGRIELNDGTNIEPCVFDTGYGFDRYTGPMQLVYVLYRSKRKTIQRVDVYAFKSYGKEYDQLCADGMRGMIDYLGISLDAWTGDLSALDPSSANNIIDRICLEGTKKVSYWGIDPVAYCEAASEEIDAFYRDVPACPLSYRLISKGCWKRRAVPAKVEVFGFAKNIENGFDGSIGPETPLWGTEPVYPAGVDQDKFVLLYNDGNYDWF